MAAEEVLCSSDTMLSRKSSSNKGNQNKLLCWNIKLSMPACRWETNACCCCCNCNGFTPKPKEIFRKRTRHSGRTQGGGGSRRKRDNKEKLLYPTKQAMAAKRWWWSFSNGLRSHKTHWGQNIHHLNQQENPITAMHFNSSAASPRPDSSAPILWRRARACREGYSACKKHKRLERPWLGRGEKMTVS